MVIQKKMALAKEHLEQIQCSTILKKTEVEMLHKLVLGIKASHLQLLSGHQIMLKNHHKSHKA